MALIVDILDDYYPPNSGVSVPLASPIYVLFDREMDEDSLEEEFFIEGPDTDQFVGPGFNLLEFPDNVSQNLDDDFLNSPGYAGIMEGTFTFVKVDMSDADVTVTGSPYRTKLVFTPEHPMTPLTQFTAHLPSADDLVGDTHSGHYIFGWTTGTGSIQYVPDTFSSSILVPGSLELALESQGSDAPLEVISTTPDDHEIQVDVETSSIIIEFNKPVESSSVTSARVTVEAIPATDHPKASATANGELITSLTVVGNKITIGI